MDFMHLWMSLNDNRAGARAGVEWPVRVRAGTTTATP